MLSSAKVLLGVYLVVVLREARAFSLLPEFGVRNGVDRSSRLNVLSASEPSDHHHHDHPRRKQEFMDLEPIPESELRKQRIEKDLEVKELFAPFGDELWDLRSQLDQLSHKLLNAITQGEPDLEETTRERLREVEGKDPELVYMLELSEFEQATLEGRVDDAKEHRETALAARSCLPQFNLEGLWIGKYGSHGYEMVNITYAGDTLIASKVTGDKNVPRGEITFQVDLSPLKGKANSPLPSNEDLQPIKLTDKAAQKWGTRQLPRHSGLGRVAEEGFQNAQWMDGQLIIISDEYFSFAWVPVEMQIFFGRPSPELALKMLRESGVSQFRASTRTFEEPPCMHESSIETLKDFATKCLEVTDELHDDHLPHEDEVTDCGSNIWTIDGENNIICFE